MDGLKKVVGSLYLFQKALAVHGQQLRLGMDIEYLLQFRTAQVTVHLGAVDKTRSIPFLVVQSILYPYPS